MWKYFHTRRSTQTDARSGRLDVVAAAMLNGGRKRRMADGAGFAAVSLQEPGPARAGLATRVPGMTKWMRRLGTCSTVPAPGNKRDQESRHR